jgi:hypothetical protein
MRSKGAVAFAIFLIALSVVGYIMWYGYVQEEKKLKYQWPTKQGTVLYYSEIWSPDQDFYDNRTVRVKYMYELNGRKYYAEQMWLYEKEVPKYLQGQTVTVYYDPLKPERSAIQPWALSTDMYVVGKYIFYGGILAVIIGFLIIISVILANRKTHSNIKMRSS